MPFDSIPQTKPLPSTDAELIADFKAWVLRQPEEAEWLYCYASRCAMGRYFADRYPEARPADGEGNLSTYYRTHCGEVSLPESAKDAVFAAALKGGPSGAWYITRSSLLRELSKLES